MPFFERKDETIVPAKVGLRTYPAGTLLTPC